MIILFGIPSEPPLAMVRKALDAKRIAYRFLHQRHIDQFDLELSQSGGNVRGTLYAYGDRINLDTVSGIYARPMDDRFLPELREEPENSPRRIHSREFHQLLMVWMELAEGRVVNRPAAMSSNSSKPYQAQLIQDLGFCIPETLVSNDPVAVLDFKNALGRVIYKSASGARSIVTEFTESDESRLEYLRFCPTQFQGFVPGFDVRVHVIGDSTFATRANSDAVDYRYSQRQGSDVDIVTYELEPELAERCVVLARGLGLDFAGIDLMVTPDGTAYCFEVNPCPAYSYYEEWTGLPIAASLADYLAVA